MQEIIKEIEDNLVKYNQFGKSDVCRLFHGRGGCFEGYQHLNIDLFGEVVFVVAFVRVEQGFFEKLSKSILDQLPVVNLVFLQTRFGERASLVYSYKRDLGLELLNPDTRVSYNFSGDGSFYEQGLKFFLLKNIDQNFGFFTDTFMVRDYILKNSDGKRILNLFAYTCAFSIFAIAGGATNVVNVDMNKNLLNHGKQNHLANNQDLRKVSFLPYPIMRSISRIRKYGPYDIIICDPPSAQKSSFNIKKEYQKLFRSAAGMLADNGVFVACCNAPSITYSEFLEILDHSSCNTSLSYEGRIDQTFSYKERDLERGLKALIFRKKQS
ncbi:MAG: class I SAM-dependent methyltransferase [Spirochaetales bacterium]|nr:class I SAM-dependent methyltransferase [Spirochaetales bacterium]